MRYDVYYNPDAQDAMLAAIRSLRRVSNTRFREALLGAMKPVDLQTSAGLSIGKTNYIAIDMPRVLRVIDRITRALYYHHIRTVIPTTHQVYPMHLYGFGGPAKQSSQRDYDSILKAYVEDVPTVTIGNTTFNYRWKAIPEYSQSSLWLMQIYASTGYLSMVAPKRNEA